MADEVSIESIEFLRFYKQLADEVEAVPTKYSFAYRWVLKADAAIRLANAVIECDDSGFPLPVELENLLDEYRKAKHHD